MSLEINMTQIGDVPNDFWHSWTFVIFLALRREINLHFIHFFVAQQDRFRGYQLLTVTQNYFNHDRIRKRWHTFTGANASHHVIFLPLTPFDNRGTKRVNIVVYTCRYKPTFDGCIWCAINARPIMILTVFAEQIGSLVESPLTRVSCGAILLNLI